MPSPATEIYLRKIGRKILHAPVNDVEIIPISGGSINVTSKITFNNSRHYFLKANAAPLQSFFEKEKNGLGLLKRTANIQTPEVIDHESSPGYQFLLLEWIEQGNKTQQFWKKFGEQLASLHHVKSEQFGLAEDNYIGALPQQNTYTKNWVEFFIRHRLQPQIQLSIVKGLLSSATLDMFDKLYKKLDSIFPAEKASLLHGDLWSGNFLCDRDEQLVLIDPAVYYGHRTIDIGMTMLFGGFDKTFYESYDYHFHIQANYREQCEISNLYPLLIHLNLFGISYLRDIDLILRKFAG